MIMTLSNSHTMKPVNAGVMYKTMPPMPWLCHHESKKTALLSNMEWSLPCDTKGNAVLHNADHSAPAFTDCTCAVSNDTFGYSAS
jgi:hypothetical protein